MKIHQILIFQINDSSNFKFVKLAIHQISCSSNLTICLNLLVEFFGGWLGQVRLAIIVQRIVNSTYHEFGKNGDLKNRKFCKKEI